MTSKRGDWKILDSKIVFQNEWIKVREDSVIRPDGNNGSYAMVEMKPGVSVLPIDEEGNVYLVKEFHYAVNRETIGAISGGIDNDESNIEAVKRELNEEAGIVADEIIDLGVLDPFTAVVYSPNHMYVAKGLHFGDSNHEGSESLRLCKIPFEQAFQMVMESKITHGATSVLILKAKELFGKAS